MAARKSTPFFMFILTPEIIKYLTLLKKTPERIKKASKAINILLHGTR